MHKPSFRRTPLAAGVALALGAGLSAPATAQTEADEVIEEIVTTGIRKSQLDAVNIKRDSESILDGIAATDLGKLPDVTVADSLQRIPGVQIQRNAGEGATVNIRGLPQIRTLLNGEQFLTAGNIGSSQPVLTDIPSQLVNGLDVYKSTSLKNKRSGLTGTIDIKTWRPLDFDEGLTSQIAAEYANGEDTSEGDFNVNGLINWNNGTVGVMLSAVTSESNLGNNYAGQANDYFCNEWCGNPDVTWLAPHGYNTFNRVVERQRDGINAAFQVDFDNGFTVTAETFYTEMEQYERSTGINISNRWSTPDWTTPTDFTETGTGNGLLSVTEEDLNAYWINSFTVNWANTSESQHHNLELKYDAENWNVRARFIDDSAELLSMNGQAQGDLSNWTGTQFFQVPNPANGGAFYPANVCAQYDPSRVNVVGDNGGCFIDPNPLGYGEDPLLHRDTSSDNVVWSGFDTPLAGGLGAGATLRDYMASVDSYAIGAFSSERNNFNTADNQIFSLDGEYFFDDPVGGFITEVRGGVRNSTREATLRNFNLFSNVYGGNGADDPNGCAVQWKAIDVTLNNPQCSAGETIGGVFQGYTANRPTRIDEFNNVVFLSDYGDRTVGLPGVWAADPRDFDDVEAFHTRVFGGANRVNRPGDSFDVELEEFSAFVDASFLFEDLNLSGTLGLRYIDTDVSVRRNEVGSPQAYGDTNLDLGDFFDDNSYDHVLPAFNLNYRPSDNWTFRFSYSKNMIAHDLATYGQGASITTLPCSTTPQFADDVAAAGGSIAGDRCFNGFSELGNPYIDPWETDNFDLSGEYYYGDASMFFLGLFRVEIDSFTSTGTVERSYADSDGVVRRSRTGNTTVLGEGGTIEGVEVGTKLDFADFTNGFFSNFGLDANYTLAPSDSNSTDLTGAEIPFPDNSEHQYNLIGWFQNERWQARLAYNWRSERFVQGLAAGTNGYQDSIGYLDGQVTYDATDNVSIYVNASNMTGEIEEYYIDFGAGPEQYWYTNEFEARYTIGVRARFE